jgi:hypothetical protein
MNTPLKAFVNEEATENDLTKTEKVKQHLQKCDNG